MISGLAVDGLSVARGDRVLFEGLDFEVRSGEAVVLTGANGAGKTSLLRAVAGLLRPAAGCVRFEGATGALDADEARRGAVHFVGHQDGLKAARTARQELAFQARWTRAGEDQHRALGGEHGFALRLVQAAQIRRIVGGRRGKTHR